jgi:excisionase family DNA binding protein
MPAGSGHDAAPAETEKPGFGWRPRRDLTRPLPAGLPDDAAAHAANRPGSARARVAEEPLLYTAEQAAALLQVRPSWLRRKAAARAVPCRFVGKHLRFSRADIETIAEGDTHFKYMAFSETFRDSL